MTSEATWLTQAAYDRYEQELEYLSTTRRVEIAKEIQEAREDGDLKENAGYHAAKDEQGQIESRIAELETLLKTAEVREAPKAAGEVVLGTVITAKINGREQRFLYAATELASETQLRIFSPESPIGQVIEGLKIGETTTYTAPNGSDVTVEIVDVETFEG